MDLEKLLALLDGSEDGKAFAKTLGEKANNADELIKKINTLEGKNSDILGSRKTQDEKYSEMLRLLGVEELTSEAIQEFKKSGKGDEKSIAEINNLKGLLEAADLNTSNVTKDYETKLSTMALDNEIANSGIGANVANKEMFSIVTSLVKQGAVFKDGGIVYQNSDGSTAYGANNQPMTLSDKINSLKSDANYSGLFKPDGAGGSGTPPNSGGGNSGQKRSEMSHSDKGAFIEKHGNDAYLKLQS
jgi:hypothetical protein